MRGQDGSENRSTSLWLIAAGILATLILAGCQSEQDEPRFSPEEEALYRDRFEQFMANFSEGRPQEYQPLEVVPGAPNPQPLPMVPHGGHTIDVDALAEATFYAESANSSAFIVWRRGLTEAGSYFRGSNWSTPLVSKSLAKPLSVVAVGRAIERGFVDSLDQPVSDFITEWRGTPKANILIRHLLDMRTGLLPQAPAPSVNDVLNRAYLHPRHEKVLIHEYPLTHPPGSRYEYSNANADLVALVLERATTKRYAQWIGEEVLQPIGAQGGAVWVNREGGLAHSGCCILLPAESWLRLAVLLIRDGVWDDNRLLPPGFVQAMRTATPQNEHAGMGVYVAGRYVERRGAAHPSIEAGRTLHTEPYQAEDLFLFDGNSNQVVYIVPSQELVILRMGERPPQSPEWDNAFLPNTLLRAIQPDAVHDIQAPST